MIELLFFILLILLFADLFWLAIMLWRNQMSLQEKVDKAIEADLRRDEEMASWADEQRVWHVANEKWGQGIGDAISGLNKSLMELRDAFEAYLDAKIAAIHTEN